MTRQRKSQAAVAALLLALLALTVGGPVTLVAHAGASSLSQPPATPPGQDAPDQFVPVKSLPQQEQLPAPMLLMTAYAFVWAALLVYVWTIWRRLMKVEREMKDLSARIGSPK